MEIKLTDCASNRGYVSENAAESFNKLTPSQVERLDILAEECADVIQAVCKIKRHGYESRHPSGGPDNRKQLEVELGGIRWAMLLMTAENDIKLDAILEAYKAKRERANKYLHHN